ncbi:shufflon system plasmid conjugative transfer pilus tip adhesin PilV [Salmonella enterica]|nr:shufflon system plasmid conjugative transfer pilus tip adhesin PilV [Salmonella enterica]EDX7012635.1 shufflon system plasmid conjugative transfer pilus tip adhesin PilV [Salmonella enterica subsp. enterica serovar Thompson]EAU1978586.1 shufflon system plasmid conjugative transfer pilus tip adhesin PilV [Salmonella enterica]EDV9029942.1 shufflon system plasmid conjugative transfer pilus tip adhesin PilV [Salmonella enterica]EEF8406739.1 shufflon system plasmid conjugative transfer pilus tip 
MNKINQGNAQLMSLVLVLGLAMMAAPRGIEMMAQQQSERIWDVTAGQFNTVQMAARQYISDNLDTLATQVRPGNPVYVSVNTLKTTGHLPAGFGANDHNQNYLIAVVSNPKMTSQLQAFVMTTGGQPWDFGALRHISSNISGLGGYVWPDNQAVGAGGGWKMKLSDYGLSSKQGSLVTFIPSDQLGTSGQGNDRLYRYAVNGHPDFNRMHTAIDMNGNNLDNAGDIKGKQAIISGGISGQSATISGEIKSQQATISGDIKSTGGWITTQGNKGWMNETHGGGFYMSDSSWVRSLNNKGIYTAGEIRGGQLRSDGDASVAGILKLDQINVADTSCPTNGAVSRTVTGAPLSCQSGLWREIGFSPTVTFFKGEWSKQLNLGKQMFCSISRVTGTDTTSPDKLRCNVAMNVATGDWTLTQNIGIGFNYCDAVCFK